AGGVLGQGSQEPVRALGFQEQGVVVDQLLVDVPDFVARAAHGDPPPRCDAERDAGMGTTTRRLSQPAPPRSRKPAGAPRSCRGPGGLAIGTGGWWAASGAGIKQARPARASPGAPMDPYDPPPGREGLLTVLLGGMVGVFFLGLLILITGGYFFYLVL